MSVMEKTKEPIRVLQINSGSVNFGGVSSFLYNVYTHINRDKVQFDFLSPNITTYGIHKEDIEEMGGRIYELGINSNAIIEKIKLYILLIRFLKDKKYEIVHINSGNFYFNLVASAACRKSGIKNIIVHSHSIANPNDKPLKRLGITILKSRLEHNATVLCACSREAAAFMFREQSTENNVIYIRNGIDTKRFQYNISVREKLRRELGLSDKIVIGHVGRFSPAKNHDFIVRLFNQLIQNGLNAVLVLIGDGKTKNEIKGIVEEYGLREKVLFLGTKSNIEDYYQMMDYFVFPSKWEGLGMSLVEAQISGLFCVASTMIPREADVTGNVLFIPADTEHLLMWEDAIVGNKTLKRDSVLALKRAQEYDINKVAAKMEDLYMGIIESDFIVNASSGRKVTT